MARTQKTFMAQWIDETGRHRKFFATPSEAADVQTRMRALAMARRLGKTIAAGARKGPKRERQVDRLVRECSKVARGTALTRVQISAASAA